MEITNTWTPAETVYSGSGMFEILKLDQDGEELGGVTFEVNGTEYRTGSDGKVLVEFSADAAKPEESYTLRIKETDAPEYYNLVSGTEVLKATTNLELATDEESLTNTYTKTFEFEVRTEVDGYVWQGENLRLIVTDQALADELVIEKSFEGISRNAFKDKSQIEFEVTGPEGFTDMAVGVNNGCEMEDNESKLVCVIDGSDVLLPVGEYKVTEKNAEIENFTYTSEPSSKTIKKTVRLGGTAKFKFKNMYESVKTASFKVLKVWDDGDDQDGVRPEELEVTLYADGEVYGEAVKLSAEGDWEYEWTELPLVNEDAVEIVYSAIEGVVDDYGLDEGEMKDGVFTFTNKHTPATVIVKVDKSWNDEENRDGLRDENSTVTFCVTGQTGDYASTPECKTVLTGVGLKTDVVVFENLPKYHAGVELDYEVTEVDMLDGYTSDLVAGEYVVISDGEGTKEVTNTHEVKPIDPCADGEGCGGIPDMTPEAPETGKFTKVLNGDVTAEVMWINYTIGGGAILLTGVFVVWDRLLRNTSRR